MDFEKWFLRNGFGVEVKENYRKCYTKGVEVNGTMLLNMVGLTMNRPIFDGCEGLDF